MNNIKTFSALIFLISALFLPDNAFQVVRANKVVSSSRAEELKRLNQLKSDMDVLKLEPKNFFNYTLLCGGKQYESRVDRTFMDKTIPLKYKHFVFETYTDPDSRSNLCPKWSNNLETKPKSGNMELLSIPENTKVGEKVYLLLAIDPESQPIYYFIRKAESELTGEDGSTDDDLIFRINVIRMGMSWFGEVILDKELDYETKQTYNYLVYAYDGVNLLEKYTLIQVTDVDDERPQIDTENNESYSSVDKQFEFTIYENASVGEIINPGNNIVFRDVDTQNSQLTIRLINLETGLADSPFTLNNNGEIRITSKLDYESQKEYTLKVNVQDVLGQFAEEIIKIDVWDVADLPPRFEIPKLKPNEYHLIKDNKNHELESDGYVTFYENKLGPVFDIKAVSSNENPLGDIGYKLEKITDKTYAHDYFEIKKHESNDTWYLNCIKKINLEDKEEQILEVVIRAVEISPNAVASPSSSSSSTPKLFTDLRVIIKIINGDLCVPRFDKAVYEFSVVEGMKQLIEPIYVNDCDHGTNGRILLSTTHPDFTFKIDQVYRFSKLGIEMHREFDYEDNITTHGHLIEFEIIARGSNQSLGQYQSRSLVRVEILDINEFVPKFVLPQPAIILKDGYPTNQLQRIFTYNVAENVDFSLEVKAIDQDRSGDGELYYNVRYLHPDDNFIIKTSYNSTKNLFVVTVPGRYLDSNSRIPIVFAIYVEDYGEPKLRNEIIVYLRPQSVILKPAYFEFDRYEFKLVELEPKSLPFELRLINDNLGRSKVALDELLDPLDLLSIDFEENSVTKGDLLQFALDEKFGGKFDDNEIANDLFVYLSPTNYDRDLDEVYKLNNYSDVYEYKIRAKLVEKPELYTDVTVVVKLIDRNDNAPTVLPNQPPGGVYQTVNKSDVYLNATLNEDFIPNSLLNINNNYTILKFADFDFSPDFGLRSLYFRVNDSRFYVDNEHIAHELENKNASFVSLLVRIMTSESRINREHEPVIWLKVTCEDNYFNRILGKTSHFNVRNVYIRVEITDSIMKDRQELFERESFLFVVDENWTGSLGPLGSVKNLPVDYKIELSSSTMDDLDRLNVLTEHFKLVDNELRVEKPFNYESGEHFFNFSVTATPAAGLFKIKTDIVVVVRDLNDETPRFTQDEYEFHLNKNDQLTHRYVGSVFAHDFDREDAKNLTVTSSDEKFTVALVSIDEIAIKTTQTLTENEYTFEITAMDRVEHMSKCSVKVFFESNRPFEELAWTTSNSETVSMLENSPENTTVTRVTMKPLGIKVAQYTIGYRIVQANQYYKIDEQTGEITTTRQVLDREETSSMSVAEQTRIFVQAYVDLDKTRYWSNVKLIMVEILDENDQYPVFVQPSNNETQIKPKSFDNIYTFLATDSDLNDRVTYSMIDQTLIYTNVSLTLPFKLNPRNGTLSLSVEELTADNFKLLLKQGSSFIKIRFTIRAMDRGSKWTVSTLFVELPVSLLIKAAQVDSIHNIIPINYELKPLVEGLRPIDKKVYTLDESTPVDSVIGDLSIYMDNEESGRKPELFDNLKVYPAFNDSINADLYFSYDPVKFSIKLIRKLDYDIVKNITLVLVGENDFKMDLQFLIKDDNNKVPQLHLDKEEQHKYGDNMVLVTVNDLSGLINSTAEAISSTPFPPRQPLPAIPELDLPVRPVSFEIYRTPELDERRQALSKFNDIRVIKTYPIIDTDLNNTFTVSYVLNETSEIVPKLFDVKLDAEQRQVLFERKNTSSQLEAGLEKSSKNFVTIQVGDGVNSRRYHGELFVIYPKQLQRIFTYLPHNGRFKGQVYRSHVETQKINLEPIIQLDNQFPYDIYLNLTGEFSKYFKVSPRVVKSSPINIAPTEIEISLREPIEKLKDVFDYVTVADLEVHMQTHNKYLNQLLEAIGPVEIKLDIRNENKYQPKVDGYSPADKTIRLDEGTYSNYEIASITAYDRDRFDPGRLEYFLIGNSNLLEINRTSGVVYLNGELDAEADQPIVFFCYARDLAHQPFGVNSDLIEFKLFVNNVNEFEPLLQPVITSIILKESVESKSSDKLTIVDEFRFDCYDRDANSSLEIMLDSVRYVSKFDSYRFIEDDRDKTEQYDLESLFRLVYDKNQTTSNQTNRVELKNYKTAYLAYTNRLDYERIYKPTETFIRLDVSCSDGQYESKSKVLIKVEDMNDNAPQFTHRHLVIHRNESNLLQTLVKIEASDADQSPEFGNYSLKYSLDKCEPNLYDIYIDQRTGVVNSRLIIDLDTEEIIRKRHAIMNINTQDEESVRKQIEFMSTFNKINCHVTVTDNNLYKSNQHQLSDRMNLTIIIDSVNDNAPEIDLDSENPIEVREGENTRSLILQKIVVFDKDDATGLQCLFGNGLTTSEPFELKTVVQDSQTALCIFKVRDDMIVDYDIMRKSFYLLELVVRDDFPPPVYPNKGVTRAQLRVRVIPVNNKPPVFVNGFQETFYVLDSIRPGTLVGSVLATDMENPNPDRIVYAFDKAIPGFASEKFALRQSFNSTSAYWGSVGLFTKAKLEVAESPYLIPVIAYDGPVELKDTLSSRKLIKVVVLNKGSMSVWSNVTNGLPVDYYSVNLAEEVGQNTPVVQVKATIPNDYQQSNNPLGDDTLPVVYSLDEPNAFYKINPTTGQISTTGRRIDYEDIHVDSQKLLRSVRVRASSPDAMFNYTTHVSINLLDVNDNPPKFESDSYRFAVVENSTHLVSPIGRVNAIDADSDLNGQVGYKLDASQTWSDASTRDLFTIDEHTGVISVMDTRRIDRELNQTIQLNVIAFDGAGLSTKLAVTVDVLDVNDNAPSFDADLVRQYRVEENQANFSIRLTATDADEGQNGTVFFYLDNEGNSPDTLRHFKVDPLSGTIELITPLDYETKRQHRLTVTCSDNGTPQRLRSTAEFVIDVSDVNDNGPKFVAANQRRVRVNETALPGDLIVQLETVDLDETPAYRQTEYDIVNVAAFKNGAPVEELSTMDVFKIDRDNGRITLGENALNVDVANEYQLQVVAFEDLKRSGQSLDALNLTILVVPSNIKMPRFERPAPGWDSGEMPSVTLFRRSLSESQPREYVVDIVKAVDPNQYGIVYNLDSVEEVNSTHPSSNQTESSVRPDDSALFSVGADDGVIKTRSRRSAYSGQAYKLSVRASSLLSPSLSTTLKLLVKVDSNVDSLFDNRVVEKTIDENVPGDLFVLQLRPKIADINVVYKFNGEYSSPLDLYAKWFKIDAMSGIIRTQENARIDCELIGEILLSVDVFDAVKQHTLVENLLVKIKIRDLNDNAPVFESNYDYEPVMREDDNTTVGVERLVTRFKANDADRTYENSALVYRIDSIHPPTIAIGSSFKLFNHADGEVSLVKLAGFDLDRDDPLIGDRVRFTIVCENTYDRSVQTRKIVTLNLEDVNDRAPKFLDTEPVVKLTLGEDYKLNEKFYHVKAVDADKPDTPNSQLIYSIAPTTSGVRIDSNGYIYLISSLDYETQPRIPLTITAYDKSTRPLYAHKQVLINVLNLNDNYPKFKNMEDECVVDVVENSPIGRVVRKFQATDLDSNSTDFIYTLKQTKASSGLEMSAPMPFVMDSVTGELRINANLDREQTDSYRLSITVDDPEIRSVRLSTQIECTIRVLDINDNKPQFDESSMQSYKILPVVNERTLIGAFRAHDPDLAENGTIEYSLVDDHEQLFSIDAQKAIVVLNLVQNFDLSDLYELQIVASDAPGRPYSSASILPVTVRIDPNYFTFNQAKNDRLNLQVPELVHVYENSAVGTRIAKLNVVNSFHQVMELEQADNVKNQTHTASRSVRLDYQLLTCNDTFGIDAKTGVIQITDSSRLDYERVKEFLLVVKVRETQQMTTFTKTRTGTDRFLVKVLNLNDNPVRFNRQVYRANVQENSRELPLSVSLDELVQLSDDDLDMTSTSQTSALNQLYPIDLRLTGADSDSFRLIELGANVYKLEAIERFDYELKNRFDFELVASDGVHKTKAKVEINIQDVNDNKPIFEKQSYVFRVDENSPVNTPVGLVHAIDLDLTPENNLTLYKLVGHGSSGHIWHETVMGAFAVNEKSGLIYVRDSSKLDREQTPAFNFTIMAYNPGRAGESFDTAEVVVYLNDLNDQIPRFESSLYQINIREKWTKLPRLIGRLHARDDDLDENGTVSYYIERVNGQTYPKRYAPQNKNTTQFYMDQSNGYLYLNAYLDADQTEQVTQSFELAVVATDLGGNKEKCTVIVSLIDVNDHDPVVLSPSESLYAFEENLPVPVVLFDLRAVDVDYRKSVISCWLDRDFNDQWKFFTIDAENRLVSQVQFDYETTREYNVRLVCRDSGIMIDIHSIELATAQTNSIIGHNQTVEMMVNDQKQFYPLERTTTKTVTIVVRDVDDNEPVFSQSDLYLVKNVSEYLQVHSTVTMLPMAHDPDTLPENCQVRYVIISGNEEGKFNLNATTGELTLEDELEISERNVYELKIAATSRSNFNLAEVAPAERSQLTLRLNILNDRRTIEFEQQDYSVSFKLEPSHEITRPLVESIENSPQLDDLLDTKALDLIHDLNLNVVNNASLFYCKSHLIKRKMKRTIGYQIEMIKFIKYNEQAIVRLPKWYASSFDGRNGLDVTNAKWIFTIDELTGKVYGNRAALKQIGFQVGDRFILTIEAVSKNFYNDETENAVTQLNIRLTEKDYTFMLPMKHVKVEKIVFDYLNPLKPGYLPRLLEADGIKVAVQDLVHSKSKVSHYLFVQIETLNGRHSVNLDTLRNYTITNKYLNDFLEQIIEREPLSEKRKSLEPENGLNLSSPFYSHWLFWLLFIIGLLLVSILGFIIFCLKSNKKPHLLPKSNKKPGIIIEYPPGVNPIYNDGVLTLENKKRLSHKKSKIIEDEKQALQENQPVDLDFEEQEMEMEMEEENDE